MSALLRLKELRSIVPASESTIRRMVAQGEFPQPIKVNGLVFWNKTDVDTWIRDAGKGHADTH